LLQVGPDANLDDTQMLLLRHPAGKLVVVIRLAHSNRRAVARGGQPHDNPAGPTCFACPSAREHGSDAQTEGASLS